MRYISMTTLSTIVLVVAPKASQTSMILSLEVMCDQPRSPRGAWGRPDLQGAADRPRTYHAHVAKRAAEKLSTRVKRDLELKPAIERIFADNFEVYGARKTNGDLSIAAAWCIIRITDRNMSAFATPSAWPRPVSRLPSAASTTPMTTLSRDDQWPLQSRGHSSAGAVAKLRGRRVRDVDMGRLV
jgi:hypothetical protein